jgi:hypothetical protein
MQEIRVGHNFVIGGPAIGAASRQGCVTVTPNVRCGSCRVALRIVRIDWTKKLG